ncbi:MAG: TonB-dependent receptor [Vicinamibacterales bacterium]
MKRFALTLVLVLSTCVSAFAQSGGVVATVTDETGGALPGATVTVSGSGGVRTAITDGAGRFSISGLAAGDYQLSVALSGFGTDARTVTVADAVVTLPTIALKVASLGETVIVSASKVETTMLNAPATVSVLTADAIESAPSQNLGDVLRGVPGLNVVQTSARDINLTNRQATSTLATSQLVLVDGRSVYLDFFGFVAWDFVPTDPHDIKQIEVVRGPASAVWGANALTGVVNIITKSPREAVGGSFNLTAGGFSRDAGSRATEGAGSAYGFSASVSRGLNDAFAIRATGGYFQSDPYSRPVGTIPVTTHPFDSRVTTGGAAYPIDGPGAPGQAFQNTGTKQPKVDVRLDQTLAGGGSLSYSGGVAGTSGIIHTGVGPFAIDTGSYLAYGRVAYSKGALRLSGFSNFLNATSSNLLLTDPVTLRPLKLDFRTRTFDVEAGYASTFAGRHVVSYGGNVRRNNFDEISIAPDVENRTELGAYVQEEFFVDNFRVAAGVRVDKFGNIDRAMVAPRISATFKPERDQSIRVSWNRAFRSPSAINNYLSLKLFAPVAPIDLRPLRPLLPAALAALVPASPVPLIVNAVGNQGLEPESLTAFEVAYTANFGPRTTVGIAWYQNDTNDNINFTQVTPSVSYPAGLPPFDVYTAANSAETGIPGALYSTLLALRIPGFPLPRTVSTYLNLSAIRQRGIELSLDHRFNESLAFSANYSFQGDPKVLKVDAGQIAYPPEEVGIASPNRLNVSVNWNTPRLVGSASVNYADKAFWVDVLGTPYAGYTDAYTMLNTYFGVKFASGHLTASLKAVNLTNETIQQHVFGDLLKRSLMGELKVRF